MDEDFDAFRWIDSEEIREIVRKSRDEGKKLERRYVLLAEWQGVLITLYFFVFSYLIQYDLVIFSLPPVIVKGLFLPILLSLPWLIIHFGGLSRWALTYKLLDVIMSRVGYFQKFFYLINAIILYLLIVIPVLTPFLSLISLIYLAYLIVKIPQSRKLRFLLTGLVVVSYGVLIFLFLDVIFSVYFDFVLKFLLPYTVNYWFSNIFLIYIASLMFAATASIGSFIQFIYEGAQQYDRSIEIPKTKIYGIQFLVFLASIAVFLVYGSTVRIFLSAILVLSFIEGLLRKLKGLSRDRTDLEKIFGIVGWVIYILFLLIELLRNILTFNPLMQLLPIIVAGVVFLIMLVYSYKKTYSILGGGDE
ncbi:MAG: hypothetical protein ACP6IP_05740 [Candidatus Njordarchaeia archaeon]